MTTKKAYELAGYLTNDATRAAIEEILDRANLPADARAGVADAAGLNDWPPDDPKRPAQDVLDGEDTNPWLGDELLESDAYAISELLMKLAESRAFQAGADFMEAEGARKIEGLEKALAAARAEAGGYADALQRILDGRQPWDPEGIARAALYGTGKDEPDPTN